MKRKTKKAIKSPQRSLPSYIEEFASRLRTKPIAPFDVTAAKSSPYQQSPTVVEQIAAILRNQARANTSKAPKKVAVKARKSRRVKK